MTDVKNNLLSIILVGYILQVKFPEISFSETIIIHSFVSEYIVGKED
ncbi:hypothetical protein SAMN03159341_101730 [Paenibacillus sp. 1_12]|nr:hypothetical protein SAMN03159341_101730 [Paenibacillus sp. 1_12]